MPPPSADPVLSVRGLSIELAHGPVRLVDDVSFEIGEREVLGVVGESGSGKSITMLAVLGLLPPGLRIAAGEIRLRGQRIDGLPFRDMRRIRGKAMSLIFQDPMTALNPVLTVGSQIAEAVRLHNRSLSRAAVRARVVELLEAVGIPDPGRRAGQHPHEFSGGMRQRAVIAMAMANGPDLLIADEPTTALDVTIQAQVMHVLAEVRERTGAATVLITHDLGLVADAADRIAVMYSGRIMETAAAAAIFRQTRHPYTAGLIASTPRMDAGGGELHSIPGAVPDPAHRPPGCPFHPRCAVSKGREVCMAAVPVLAQVETDGLPVPHASACHFPAETSDEVADAVRPAKGAAPGLRAAGNKAAVLQVERLSKVFPVPRRSGWGHDSLHALSDVSFAIKGGSTLGLVGESGCGKSTLSKVVLQLEEPTGGAVFLNGEDLTGIGGSALRAHRKDIQVVFQDPYSSLDPRFTIHDVVAEPLRISGRYDAARVSTLLRQVGIGPEAEGRKPADFSGGQRQRIAIARALATQPSILILDEAVSALDVSIQAQVINLLKRLQAEFGLAYLFISHDLAVVRHVSDDVAVMYLGKIVEIGSRDQIFGGAAHPYTQALLSAIPGASGEGGGRIVLKGELPNPLSPPSGCRFRTRCFKAAELCRTAEPELIERTEPGHRSACHFAAPLAADAGYG